MRRRQEASRLPAKRKLCFKDQGSVAARGSRAPRAAGSCDQQLPNRKQLKTQITYNCI